VNDCDAVPLDTLSDTVPGVLVSVCPDTEPDTVCADLVTVRDDVGFVSVCVKEPNVAVGGGDRVGGIVPDPAETVLDVVPVGPGDTEAESVPEIVDDADTEPAVTVLVTVAKDPLAVAVAVDDAVGVGGTGIVGVGPLGETEAVPTDADTVRLEEPVAVLEAVPIDAVPWDSDADDKVAVAVGVM
jgi:hypothetical protein